MKIQIKNFLRQVTVINCILSVAIAIVVFYDIDRFMGDTIKLPAAAVSQSDPSQAASDTVDQSNNLPMQDIIAIAEHNLFHPDRIIPAKKKEEADVPRPELVLFGTMVANDNLKVAYMSDKKNPRKTPGRGDRQIAVKQGEVISGYTLKDVSYDHVTLTRGDDTIVLNVISPENRKREPGPANPLIAPGMPGAPASLPQGPHSAMQPPLNNQMPASPLPSAVPNMQPPTQQFRPGSTTPGPARNRRVVSSNFPNP